MQRDVVALNFLGQPHALACRPRPGRRPAGYPREFGIAFGTIRVAAVHAHPTVSTVPNFAVARGLGVAGLVEASRRWAATNWSSSIRAKWVGLPRSNPLLRLPAAGVRCRRRHRQGRIVLRASVAWRGLGERVHVCLVLGIARIVENALHEGRGGVASRVVCAWRGNTHVGQLVGDGPSEIDRPTRRGVTTGSPVVSGRAFGQQIARLAGRAELAGLGVSAGQGAHPAGWQVYLGAAALTRGVFVHRCVVLLRHVADAVRRGIVI